MFNNLSKCKISLLCKTGKTDLNSIQINLWCLDIGTQSSFSGSKMELNFVSHSNFLNHLSRTCILFTGAASLSVSSAKIIHAASISDFQYFFWLG